jgi:4-hydroxymandelate oxidase
MTKALVERAEASGMRAIRTDGRCADAWPSRARSAQSLSSPGRRSSGERTVVRAVFPCHGAWRVGLANHFASGIDAALTWKDVDWLRSITKLPVLIKGIVRCDDAARAVDHGAAGVIVSNHGGRQLDTAIASVRALPEVAEAVAGRAKSCWMAASGAAPT